MDVLNNVFLAAMVTIVGAQVFFRYVLNSPIGWSEEVGRATLVWITFFGSFAAFSDDKHMRISLLYNKFSESRKRLVRIYGNIAVMVLNIFVVVYGFKFAFSFTSFRSAYLEIPMSLIYSILPVSAILWTVSIAINTYVILYGSWNRKEKV